MTIQLISANHASAMAATLAGRANRNARGFGGGVYPITPQTECIELLCRQQFDKGSIVRVESEHSAMAVCMGMSVSGARTFTASSSNGLAYMAENVYAAAFSRLPIVMMAVNRTLGPPWNIWVDHGDTLMLRDAGWIQLYCQDNQEVADSIIFSYRLAEDARVLLPAMVCQDAFVLSHTMMETDLPEQEQVDRYLPDLDLPHRVKFDPVMIGGLDFPRETEVHRRQHQEALERVFDVYGECQDEFEEVFGRRPPDPVVPYCMDDAEIAFVSMGTTSSTTDTVVDKLRAEGIRAGSVRVRMYRPFPEKALTEMLANCERVGVLDRDISLGLGGVLWSEVRGCAPRALVQGYMLGLGGGDVRPQHIE
ncbi:MAG: pyruvate ferredoxin oxidoreductase, partial [Planctomycetota bacterium]|nr:pyruvate ferredoxin oxidoreductase [Planctomycetota bacterium]